MENQADLFSCEDGDDGYNNIKHGSKELRDEINNIYHEALPYLDTNFRNEFSKNYYSRSCELFVIDKILQSLYRDSLALPKKWKGKDDAGPDFKLSLPEKNLYIECVCPQEADRDKKLKVGNYTYLSEILESGVNSSTASGENEDIISRFTSSLRDKACQFKKYTTSRIMEELSYKALFVSGIALRINEAKTHNSDSILSFSLSRQFECAIHGKRETSFNFDDKRNYLGIEESFKNFEIQKPIEGGIIDLNKFQEEFLKNFDVIIYSDLNPFLTQSDKPFDFFYNKEKEIEDQLKDSIENIFCQKW